MQHNLYNVMKDLQWKNSSDEMKRAAMYLHRYELDCHQGRRNVGRAGGGSKKVEDNINLW